MGFGVSPIGLVNDLMAAVNALRGELLGADLPKELFHYTSTEAVIAITNSRIVRATCVSDLGDKSEVNHGANLIAREVEKTVARGVPAFAAMVLTEIPEQVRRRIPYTYVTCFCADSSSLWHWKKFNRWGYGDNCLKFQTSPHREPLLRPAAHDAYVQYYRVIYGHHRQSAAIRSAIATTVAAVNRHTYGVPEGPWMKSMVGMVVRNAAELFLDLIISFKRMHFIPEQEWRLVVRPSPALCSSAPQIADDNFAVMVKRNGKRYIELYLPAQRSLFMPTLRPPVPFVEVKQSPWLRMDSRDLVRESLEQNSRPDIPVSRSRWWGRGSHH